MVGWRQIEVDDVLKLLFQILVIGQLEALDAMLLQSTPGPDALDSLIPASLAIVDRLQWVEPAGMVSSVSLMTFDFVADDRGLILPGLVLSFSMPDNPSSAYRFRKRPTFPGSCPRRAAISLLFSPCAASRMICERSFKHSGPYWPAQASCVPHQTALVLARLT